MQSSRTTLALVVAGTLCAAAGANAQDGQFGLQSPSGGPDGLGAGGDYEAGVWSPDFYVNGQSAHGPEPKPEVSAAVRDEPVIDGSGAAVEWLGKPLVSTDGSEVGTVREVIVDTSGMVSEVHAEIGGFLGMFQETVTIPAERIMFEERGRLLAEMSADEIRSAPRVEGES